MTFRDCLHECASNDDLVAEFDRLWGTNLSRKGAPVEVAIDDASGRTRDDLAVFINFVYETIWTRLSGEVRDSG